MTTLSQPSRASATKADAPALTFITVTCVGCEVQLGIRTASEMVTSPGKSITGRPSSLLASTYVVTAYTYITKVTDSNTCTTITQPVPLQSSISVVRLTSIPEVDFQYTLSNSLREQLGYVTCTDGPVPTATVPTSDSQVSPTPVFIITSSMGTRLGTANNSDEIRNISTRSESTISTPTPAQSESGVLLTSQEAGIAVGVSVGSILLALIGWSLWWRRRKQQNKQSTSKTDSNDPYLQPKAELEDEQSRRRLYELATEGPRFELDGQGKVEKGDSERPPEKGENEWATEIGFLNESPSS